jgi:hypothetical protein
MISYNGNNVKWLRQVVEYWLAKPSSSSDDGGRVMLQVGLARTWDPLFSGLEMVFIVAGFDLVGDGLRDSLDARLNGTAWQLPVGVAAPTSIRPLIRGSRLTLPVCDTPAAVV